MVRLVCLVGLFLVTQSLFSQDIWSGYKHLFLPVEKYVVYHVNESIEIDGKADESSWAKAEWTEYYKDIEGDRKPVPEYKTRCKMLWDEQNLYIYAELEEPHIWAYYDKNDMIVFHENDFEVFIDPDRSTHKYYEFEVNARNTLFDLYLPKPYRNGGKANIPWNAKGFKSEVFIDGTLNDPTDKDKMWAVEMVIPFASLSVDKDYILPKKGDTWKIGFSRVEWQTDIINGKYIQRKDKTTNKKLPEDNWVWSPQGLINMHFPERWGMIQFASNKAGETEVGFKIPEEEVFARYLWLLYYKQQTFHKNNGKYALSLEELELPQKLKSESGCWITYKMNAGKLKFEATIQNENGLKLSINHEGLFKKLN